MALHAVYGLPKIFGRHSQLTDDAFDVECFDLTTVTVERDFAESPAIGAFELTVRCSSACRGFFKAKGANDPLNRAAIERTEGGHCRRSGRNHRKRHFELAAPHGRVCVVENVPTSGECVAQPEVHRRATRDKVANVLSVDREGLAHIMRDEVVKLVTSLLKRIAAGIEI